MQEVEVVVVSISNPLLIGIYKNKILDIEYKLEGKTSDIIAEVFSDILKIYHIDKIYYVNGPGSYMSIKVSYIFLKTLSITKQIELFAINGFELNQNSPIKALGKKYFIQKDDKIVISDLNGVEVCDFVLPKSLENIKSSLDNLPNYVLPAV